MKLVLDEKLKHRLIGLAVIISLGAIFAPAVVRKSSQHVDSNFSVTIKLPPKPLSPDVVAVGEKDVFKTIKVARVHLPTVAPVKPANPIARAELIKSAHSTVQLARTASENKIIPVRLGLNDATQKTVMKAVVVAANAPLQRVASVAATKKSAVASIKIAKTQVVKVATAKAKPVASKALYAVQLASFSQLSNAQSLVNRLHSKGYKASYIRVSGRSGAVYKVFAGHSPYKNDVLKLKSQLASGMQLNGFVVTTGVS